MKRIYFAAQLAPMTNGMKTWISAYDAGNGLFVHKTYSGGLPGPAWVVSHHSGLAIETFWRMPLHYAQRYAIRLGQKADMTKSKEEILDSLKVSNKYKEAIRQTYLEISLDPVYDAPMVAA